MSILKLKRKNIIIISLIVLFLLIINPLLGFIGEKAAPKMLPDYIGRSISIENIDINLYTGTLLLEDFAIFEPDGKERFFTFNKFFINIQILKLFIKKIHIETIELVKPSASIKVENKKFNFDDIIAHIASMKKPDAEPEKKDKSESNIQLLIEKFSIVNTGFSFSDPDRGLNLAYNIDDLTVNNLKLDKEISLISNLFDNQLFEIGASIDSSGDDFLIGINIKRFNLKHLLPIFKIFLNSSEITGNVNADLKVVASKNFKKISISGVTELLNFILKDLNREDVASVKELKIGIKEVKPLENIIDIDKVYLAGLKTSFNLYKDTNNFEKLIKKTGKSTKVPEKKEKPEKSKPLKYRVGPVHIEKANLGFVDKSNEIPFSAFLRNLEVKVDNITSGTGKMKFSVTSGLNSIEPSIRLSGEVENLEKPEGVLNISLGKTGLSQFNGMISRFVNISQVKGELSLNSDISFKIAEEPRVLLSSDLQLDKLLVIDSRSINIFSIDSIDVKLNKFDNISNRIDVDSITIETPALQFYETNEGNTIDLLKKPQVEKEEKTAVSKEEKVEKSKESESKLSLKSLKLKNGSITYQDYKLKGNPRVVVSRVNTDISNFSNFEDKKALIDFSSSIGTKGTIRSNGYAKIFGVKDANITATAENIDLSKLRTILNSRSPVKIKQGEVNFDGKLKLKNKEIDSENKLILHDIKLLDDKKAVFGTKIPLSILLTILEDTKKNITLDIPVKGDLSKPSFEIGTVIAGVLKDLVLNIISSPLKILKALGGVKEDITFLEWGYLSAESDINLKKLNQLSGIVKNKENVKIAFNEIYKASAFKKEIGLLLVENIYFDDMRKQKSEVKNKELDVMSIEFQDFISRRTTKADGSKSLDEKIELIVGKEVIEKEMQNILKKKRDIIMAAFSEQDIDPSRFIVNENKVIDSDSENIIYEVSVSFLSGP